MVLDGARTVPEVGGLAGNALAGILVVLFVSWSAGSTGLRMAARLDHLTGMGNRKALEEALEAAVGATERARASACSCMDLDGFKQINDTLGHDAGDLVLQEIAERLHANTFEYDTAARMGGDEFAVVLRRLTDGRRRRRGARLRDALVRPIEIEGSPASSASASARRCAPSTAGPRPTCCGRPTPRCTAPSGTARASASTRRAPPEGAEESWARRGAAAGHRERPDQAGLPARALPGHRTHRDRGGAGSLGPLRRDRVPPSEFVPLAEETGLIRQLTQLTLRKALDEVKAWRDAGVDVPVSVNLSGRLVTDRSLPGVVEELLEERGLTGTR